MRIITVWTLGLLVISLCWEPSLGWSLFSTAAVAAGRTQNAQTSLEETIPPLNRIVTTVAVTGATGRTGRLVVEELLKREVPSVIAVVRDMDKAKEVFPTPPSNLKFVQCDLLNEKDITNKLSQIDAAIWCATGFSTGSNNSVLQRIKTLLGLVTKRSIDTVGLPILSKVLLSTSTSDKNNSEGQDCPKLVMCSSAGVTRPSWDDSKKAALVGAADIPIVRLNPFGILDIKRESEEKVRQSGISYCIVRPAGLNDDWPAESRPVLSQGDVAVGRINRKDVAQLLVDVLGEPQASNKTFEVITLAGYPKATSIRKSLEKLRRDGDGEQSFDGLLATYAAMQQLLPGEKQDSAALAMGQTYEQLDKDEEGRLGKRGEEDAESSAPKPSS